MNKRIVLAVISTFLPLTSPLVSAHEGDELGSVTFPTSCDPAVQADFEKGVAMLHSYWFNIAGQKFRSILAKDPGCTIAYWGMALDLLGNSLAFPPSAKDAQAAWEALEKARAAGAKTQRERDWIDAITEYFRDFDKTPVNQRLARYNAAMEKVAAKYPDDYEAQVFYALTLQASAPTTDVTYASQLKSAAMLEKLYQQNPRHPGVTHFLIHAYDYPPLADKGVPAARRYAGIAPAVPHARHMPSHIYSMVGLWEDSIASNMAALEIQPDYYHAYDFSVYAALQMGQDARARAMAEKAAKTPVRGDRPVNMGTFMALATVPARCVLERGDWGAAAALPVTETKYPIADAITRFTRGLGMARGGNLAGAKAELQAMEIQRATLQKNDQAFWARRTEEWMSAVAAWITLAEGDRAKAEKLMRAAADGEDGSVKNVLMENRLYPLREMLAELLLQEGQPAASLKEYETAVAAYPNRYRGLYGAARAAEAAGDGEKAAKYFRKFVELGKAADDSRLEVAFGQEFLARR